MPHWTLYIFKCIFRTTLEVDSFPRLFTHVLLFSQSRSRVESNAKYTLSKLNFVDLAGSERLGKTQVNDKICWVYNKSDSFVPSINSPVRPSIHSSIRPFIRIKLIDILMLNDRCWFNENLLSMFSLRLIYHLCLLCFLNLYSQRVRPKKRPCTLTNHCLSLSKSYLHWLTSDVNMCHFVSPNLPIFWRIPLAAAATLD